MCYFLKNNAGATSFRDQRKIEFRDLKNLGQIKRCFSTGSLEPGVLCAVSPSTLLCVDQSVRPHSVYWMDCSGTAPRFVAKTISTGLEYLFDIYYVPDLMKPWLIASSYGFVNAYVTNMPEWSTKAQGNSVTTDGRNYVIVQKYYGDSIELYSLSDGKKQGCLAREGDCKLGRFCHVRWCSKTLCLVVAHCVNDKIHVSTIQFE